MSRNTFLLWIRLVISDTYESAFDEDYRWVRGQGYQSQEDCKFFAVQKELCNPASIEG